MKGKWIRHSVEQVFESPFVTVDKADVELPDKTHIDQYMVKRPNVAAGVGVLAYTPERGVLLIWRHRVVTDTWGWELPAGGVEAGESLEDTAAREVLEETGWKVSKLTRVLSYFSVPGMADIEQHVVLAKEAEWVGPGRDENEAADLAWLPLDQVRSLMKKGDISDDMTLVGLLWAMQFGIFD